MLIYSLKQEQFESEKGKTMWAFVENPVTIATVEK